MPNMGWKAIYKDGSVIKQFPEHHLGHLKEVGRPPIKFFVGNKWGIDLEQGSFYINKRWLKVADSDGRPLVPERMLFFMRHRYDVCLGTDNSGHTKEYFVGFQYKDMEIKLRVKDNKDFGLCYSGLTTDVCHTVQIR